MRDVRIVIPELHVTQKRVKAEAKRYNVVDCGRQWGKTLLCKELVLDMLLEGKPCAYTQPTYKMLADVWREVSEMLLPITKEKSEQEKRIELISGGVIDFWSLDSPNSIRGRRYARVILDEAAMVRDLEGVFNEIVRPTLIVYQGDAWFPSTPKGMNGFYRMHLLGRDERQEEWKSWHFTSYDNPHLKAEELDGMRATMTQDAFRQEILAEFLENEGQVFRMLGGALLAPVGGPESHVGHSLVAGVDWGRDNDFTAISVGCVDCKREVALERFNQIDYAFQRQRLMGLLRKWGVQRTVVESNSIGTPILEQLQRDGVKVVGFMTTNS